MKLSDVLRGKLCHIELLCLDVDGVLTDGGLYYGSAFMPDVPGAPFTGTPLDVRLLRFHSADGHGIRLLQDAGVKVAWITGNHWPGMRDRAHTLGVHYLASGIDDKATALRKVADDLGVPLDRTAYMGDDLPDLPALRLAGVRFAPANAAPEVLALADVVTVACGGKGAVREVADLLVAAQKKGLDRPSSGP